MRNLFLIIAFGFLSCYGYAQDKTVKKHIVESKSLVGIWQLGGELKMGENTKTVYTPTIKIYNEDGTFCVMRMFKEGPLIVTLYGNYEILKDGKLVEYVSGSLSDPHLVGTKSDLNYKIEKEGSRLEVRYKLATADGWASETWIRSVFSLPNNKNSRDKKDVGLDL